MYYNFKVGRITVALGLVGFGIALLLDNLGVWTGGISLVYKFWPLLLIGFGIEYLVQSVLHQRRGDGSRVRWDVGGAFLMVFLILLSLGITGFRTYVLPGGGNLLMGIGPSETETKATSGPVGNARELVTEVSVGSITINPSANSSEFRVEASYTVSGFLVDRTAVRQQLDAMQLNVNSDGDSIRITSVPSIVNNVSIHYTIYVPDGLKVRATTGTGSINATGFKGDMQLSSTVGRIEASAGSGTLTINSGSGSITVSDYTGPVEARTNLGSVDVRNVNGALQLDSRTGSITVRDYHGGNLTAETGTGRVDVSTNLVLEGNVSLKTQTGSISLDVPRESSVRATAQTRTGSLTVPGFMTSTRSGPASSAVGTSGDGKYTVTLEASTGSVHFGTR